MDDKCKYFWKNQSGVVINHMRCDDLSDSKLLKIKASSCTKLPIVFLIIPGNPGLINFYEKFSNHLYSLTEIPVWGISHTGHNRHTQTNEGLHHPETIDCGLENQIQHKIDFLNEEVFPYAEKVILIGHSIGCYVILQILKRMREKEFHFAKAILLFPTIERMRITPNGKRMTPVLSKARWLLVISAGFLSSLPTLLKTWMVWLMVKSQEHCITQTIMDRFNSQVADCCTYMALQEMYEVDVRDDDIIEENIGKLIFYYGATDEWCPISYYEDVKKQHGSRFNSNNIHLCKQNISHGFVLKHSSEIADLVSQWILPIKNIL